MTTPSSGKVEDGDNFVLTCATTSSLANPSYILTTGGADGTPQTNNVFPIVDAVIATVASYTCKASFDGGASYSENSPALTPTGNVSVIISTLIRMKKINRTWICYALWFY